MSMSNVLFPRTPPSKGQINYCYIVNLIRRKASGDSYYYQLSKFEFVCICENVKVGVDKIKGVTMLLYCRLHESKLTDGPE